MKNFKIVSKANKTISGASYEVVDVQPVAGFFKRTSSFTKSNGVWKEFPSLHTACATMCYELDCMNI